MLACARSAVLAETDSINRENSDGDPYDQYEFSVRLEVAGDCVRQVPACACTMQCWCKQRLKP